MKPTYRELQKFVRENGIPVSGRSKYAVLEAAIRNNTGLSDTSNEDLKKMSYRQLLKIKRDYKIKSVTRKREDVIAAIIKKRDFRVDELLSASELFDDRSLFVSAKKEDIKYEGRIAKENGDIIREREKEYFNTPFASNDEWPFTKLPLDGLKEASYMWDFVSFPTDIDYIEYGNDETFEEEYKKKFDEHTIGRPFPFYIRVFGIYEPEADMERMSKPVIIGSRTAKFILIEDADRLKEYKDKLLSRLAPYDADFDKIKAEIDIHVPGVGTTDILRVAQSPDENCLLKLIRTLHPQKLEKLYKKYPELQTQKYLDCKQIDTVAKYTRLNIRAYTPLGSKLNSVWDWFGYQNDKVLSVVVNNEHARVRLDLTHIDRVTYVKTFDDLDDINIIHVEWEYIGTAGTIYDREIQYIIRYDNGDIVLEKVFRPSSVTNNTEDDICKTFFRCYKPEQVLYKIFAKENIRSIKDDDINKIVIQAEHFIGRRVIKPIPKIATEVDHNRNYSAYETLPEYMGFPESTLIASKQPSSPAFVVINNIYNPPEFFVETMNYKSGEIVLPYPDFKYISQYCKIDVNYYLNAKFRHISIYDFARKYDRQHEKVFINSAIGRTIAGGLSGSKRLQFEIKNDNELQQVINECSVNKLEYTLSADGLFTAYLPERPRGDYCFHSYILSYARLHLWKKWLNYKVCGFNVDALIVEGKHEEFSTKIGEWKTGPVKAYFRQMEISEVEPKKCELPQITVADRYVSLDNVLIVGPAGISKSFTEINDPVHGQIMATPRIELRDSFKQYFTNTHTGQKLFQLSSDDSKYYSYLIKRIPRNYSYLVLDEVGMYTREEHDIIFKRMPEGTILRYLYDPEQIHNNLTNNPVDIQYFIDNGFRVEYLERTPETRARHEYNYGCKLDKIREGGLDYVVANFQRGSDVRNTDHIISGNHARVKLLNDYYRQKFDMFPVRDKKRNYSMKRTDDPDIYWDKKTMSDEIPKGYKYLPALAITPDSIQGRTITDKRLFVDYNHLHRQGCLYVAMTRTTEETLTFLYDDEPSLC